MLKFICKNCGEEIIVKYLKPGEVTNCRNCGTENDVPGSAEETDELPEYLVQPAIQPLESTAHNVLKTAPISVKDWFFFILLLEIPLVNLITIIYCVSNKNVNVNVRNLCSAALIWIVIYLVLVVLIIIIEVPIF